MTRAVLWALLVVVAGAAAVLSFSALRDLAVACGFRSYTAPLLPVVVDAGCAAGTLAWLGQPPGSARRFGRALALALLVGSVAGNALGHALAAYSLTPAWQVVVVVSAVAPAVLAGVVHLAALMAQANTERPEAVVAGPADDARVVGRRRLAREMGITEHQARQLLAERNGATR